MKSKSLSKSDIKQLNQELEQLYGISPLNKKDRVVSKEDTHQIIYVNDKPFIIKLEQQWVPTIIYLQTENPMKKITVDMGAIKFVIKGADIMRPGITNIEQEITENQLISIIDEKNGKCIAIGQALLNTEDMQQTQTGKVIKNLHYVGDLLWKQYT